MKKTIGITILFVLFVFGAIAQPTTAGGAYTESQARQARENAEMNRHYESMKPSKKTSSNNNISGDYNAYGWGDYSRMDAINAAEKRQQKLWDDYFAKKDKLAKLIKERNIVLSKENFSQLVKAGLDAGFTRYDISTFYKDYDPDYKPMPDGYYDWSGNYLGGAKPTTTVKTPVQQTPKLLSDLSSSDRQLFEKRVNDAKNEKEIHLQINNLEIALKIFNDPKVQYELAKLYLQKGEYVKARSMLYYCYKNEILLNKPSAREQDRLEAYSYLLESIYDMAEGYYARMYKETENDKEIICETASANFRMEKYENVYNIMKNANENNPENKVIYSLAGAAVLAIDSSFKSAEKLFSSVASIEKDKNLEKQIAKKLYEEVQTYRKQTGKVTVVTIFLLDLAVKLDPTNIDYRAERYDSNAFLGRKKETIIDESFLKY